MTSDVWVLSITHLKGRPNADRALHQLQRIASLVKPIMRKHNWKLPVLAEFFPESPNLLGELSMLYMNMGQKILVRLRPAHSPDTFYPEEDLIGTMLHELTHNVHGPHDDKFYKFLAGLNEEFDALQRSGYAGEGFFSEGKRLGTNISHNLPLHLARAKALEAAEKRRQTARVLGSGGKLGGGIARVLSPREAAAQAAERRARDEKACGSGPIAQREAAKAAEQSVTNEVIDLTLDDPKSDHSDDDIIIVEDTRAHVAGPSKVAAIPQSKAVAKSTAIKVHPSRMSSARINPKDRLLNTTPSSSKPSVTKLALSSRPAARIPTRSAAKSVATEWACPACTLLNPQSALQCDACTMRRPPDERTGWSCLACGTSGMPHDFWTCTLCGTVKLHS
ncbi:WLM domain-containing protein [Crucibulum laeve]|uniref:WLM domain-containing protein n=1 Tax=Crucibulum laeve TaxID=68775 RepID=A0A5C3MBF6_9AGAR|nr:WLM domain-containing protein [Crucibulum laeve]